MRTPRSDERCPAETFGVRCERPAGHNSPHENTEDGKVTWEPAYVADLRCALEDARRTMWRMHLEGVLDDLGNLSSEAIDDAREALAAAKHREQSEVGP